MDDLVPFKVPPFDFGPLREVIGSGRKLIAETMGSLPSGEGKELPSSILGELDEANANFERITPPAMEELRQSIEASVSAQISLVEESQKQLQEIEKLKDIIREAESISTPAPEQNPFHPINLKPDLPSIIEEGPTNLEPLPNEDLLKFLLAKEPSAAPETKVAVSSPKTSGNIWENWSQKTD